MEVIAIHEDIKKRIKALSEVTQAQVVHLIELLELREYHLAMPYSKRIEKDLYELRVLGEQSIRIFYTFHKNRAVLLHLVTKKAQKLQKKDLETARKRILWLR